MKEITLFLCVCHARCISKRQVNIIQLYLVSTCIWVMFRVQLCKKSVSRTTQYLFARIIGGHLTYYKSTCTIGLIMAMYKRDEPNVYLLISSLPWTVCL